MNSPIRISIAASAEDGAAPANTVSTAARASISASWVRRINNALRRADQIDHSEGDDDDNYWMAPIVVDAEAGFGGALNAYELMRAMIEAGAAGVHFEHQLASEKKCVILAARSSCRLLSTSGR